MLQKLSIPIFLTFLISTGYAIENGPVRTYRVLKRVISEFNEDLQQDNQLKRSCLQQESSSDKKCMRPLCGPIRIRVLVAKLV